MEEIQISTPPYGVKRNRTDLNRQGFIQQNLYEGDDRGHFEEGLESAEGFDVIEINGNAFMFKFTDKEEFNRVLRGRPWSINGFLLNLMERSTYKTCEEFDFSRCPVWIRMHNVPMEAWCLENAITIGGYVGEVVRRGSLL
ncbi:hypothetical protein K1719_022356 [Acacia pycnantha]|nr:hypothetical protein K1719_022356 [Acacia pycnantha]